MKVRAVEYLASNWRRALLFICGGLFLAYLIIWVSLGQTLRGAASVSAERSGVFDARSIAAAADYTLQADLVASQKGEGRANSRANISAAKDGAERALRRDLLIPQAWRVFATAEEAMGGTPEDTELLVEFSSQISRRDLGTNLWLLDRYARTERLSDAFRQLDLALRRSSEGRSQLLPVLAAGLVDDDIRSLIVEALVRSSLWRDSFFLQLGETPPSEEVLSSFFRELPFEAFGSDHRNARSTARKLLFSGRFESAFALQRRLDQSDRILRNGNFESENANPPFDWEFQSTTEYDAAQGSYGGEIDGASALYVRVSSQDLAQVARQAIQLAPGTYRLTARAGSEDPDRRIDLDVSVFCATETAAKGVQLATLSFEKVGSRSERQSDFVVSEEDCVAQWISVSAGLNAPSLEGEAWVDSVAISRLGRSSG